MDQLVQLLEQLHIDPKLLIGIIGTLEGIKSADKQHKLKPYHFYIQVGVCAIYGILTSIAFLPDWSSVITNSIITTTVLSGTTTLLYLYGIKIIKGFYDKYLKEKDV